MALFAPAAPAAAAGKAHQAAASEPHSLPYLGPGTDKLSAAEYERIYKNYIQTSILLGYPFTHERGPACEQALSALFRQVGMFGYPVPVDAQEVKRSTKKMSSFQVETFQMGGVIIQVARDPGTHALDRVVLVNSSSPKAVRHLSQIVRQELLELKRDPITGLERVQRVPVGYPHPLLGPEGQGLVVKELRFNRKAEGCEPVEFHDNAWVAGFDLSQARCAALQADAEMVWKEKLAPSDFAERELERMKQAALKNSLAKGMKESEAKALLARHFVRPLTNEINVVGSAMRNLAQCNLLALGRPGVKAAGSPAGGEAEKGESNGDATGAGAAH